MERGRDNPAREWVFGVFGEKLKKNMPLFLEGIKKIPTFATANERMAG